MSTIVAIEDNLEILDNLVDLLEAEGHEVHPAADGEHGLEAVRQQRPDVIVCDIMMPGMDGYEVLRRVREDEDFADTPFLFLTARTERTAQRAGMELGADDYLTKPFSQDELLRAVGSRLERARVHDERAQARMDELRHDLSRSIPHELRTPLAGILGYGELLRDGWREMDAEDVDDMLAGIERSAHRLRRAGENIGLYAEFAREDADEPVAVDGATTPLEDVEKAVRDLATEHGRQEDLHVALEAVPIAVPEFHLRKLLEELTDNACKFSEIGTPIEVSGRVEGEHCRLSVEDGGRGMDAGEIRQIGAYRQFGRDEHEQQGLGLGLTLVRNIAHSAGGTVDIESTPGEGTTVVVVLPVGSPVGSGSG